MWMAKLLLLWTFAAAVLYTDLRYRRVSNRLILIAAIGGLALAAGGGWDSLRTSILGMCLGFLLLFPAFILHMVGGGDVKSLAVIGLLAGPGLLLISFMIGAAAGGLAAAFVLAVRRCRNRRRRDKEGGGGPAWTLPYAGILSLAASLSALFLRAP